MIKPEIGMPVLYWFAGATAPLPAVIALVRNADLVDLHTFYLTTEEIRCVALRQGGGNESEIGHTTEAFCEFPQWFIDVMRAARSPMVVVNPDPLRHWRYDIPQAQQPQPVPPGSDYVIFCHPLPRNDKPLVTPTSQVLG
jgi:hypothetical protein